MYIMGVKWNRLPNKYQTYIQCIYIYIIYIYIYIRACAGVCVCQSLKPGRIPKKWSLYLAKSSNLIVGFPSTDPASLKPGVFHEGED